MTPRAGRETGALLAPLQPPYIVAAAISGGLPHTRGWETGHWTEASAEQPPSWEDARARLDAVRQ